MKLWGIRDTSTQVRGTGASHGGGLVKTRCPQCLGWSGLAGDPWAGPLPGITQREQRAPGRRPAPPIAPSLSQSAMAVESFTATAPFVQIGRFFLSAGESLPLRMSQRHPEAPCFYLATSQELGSLLRWVWDQPARSWRRTLGRGPEGRQVPRRWGTCVGQPHPSQAALKHGLFQRITTRPCWCLI